MPRISSVYQVGVGALEPGCLMNGGVSTERVSFVQLGGTVAVITSFCRNSSVRLPRRGVFS